MNSHRLFGKNISSDLNKQQKMRGFTILEVITAIFILTIGAGASFALIQQTLSSTYFLEDKLIASYLAQEGIEIVKNIRDGNWLEGRSAVVAWDAGLICGTPPCLWEADYTTLQNLTAWSGQGRYLNIDSDGFYSYAGGTQTKFKRKITIEEPQADKMKVTAEVIWQERGRTHSIEALEYITNWYGR